MSINNDTAIYGDVDTKNGGCFLKRKTKQKLFVRSVYLQKWLELYPFSTKYLLTFI